VQRPIAPGLIQGALRGLLAGAFTAAVAAVLAALAFDPVLRPSALLIVLGIPILTTVLGAGDGIEARVGRNLIVRWLAPIVGGALAGMVIASAWERVEGKTPFGLPSYAIAEATFWGAVACAPISAALGIAGMHQPGASIARRYVRALKAAAFLATISFPLADPDLGSLFPRILYWILSLPLVYCTGHVIIRPIGRSIGEWLEPRDEEEPQPAAAPPPPIA